MPSSTQKQATQAASGLLQETWAGGLPIDPILIARRLGIQVYETKLDPSVSGAIIKERGRDPRIVLNTDDTRNRQRFTCAHELGHFVRRSNGDEDPNEFEYIDERGLLAAEGTDTEEVFANAFAAQLLMPKDEVKASNREGLSVVEMTLRFGVSVDAMRFRLKNLGFT